jgi:hypothetical protein
MNRSRRKRLDALEQVTRDVRLAAICRDVEELTRNHNECDRLMALMDAAGEPPADWSPDEQDVRDRMALYPGLTPDEARLAPWEAHVVIVGGAR